MENKKNKYLKSKILSRLLTEKRTPYLFIGSGFTKRYIPTALSWEELLNKIAEIIKIDQFILTNKRTSLSQKNNPGTVNQYIASFLKDKINESINKGEYSHIFNAEDIKAIQEKHYDSFKYLISKICAVDELPSVDIFNKEKYKITELKLFKKLKNNIPGIFTTNYDCLIELLFENEFEVYCNQQDYFYRENYNYAEIYKIHGSTSDPNSIIISKEDYDNYSSINYLTISKILQVASSNPIIFIGYSMNDDNINQIIENLMNCLNDEQIKLLEKNLVFISWQEHSKYFLETKKEFKINNKSLNMNVIVTDNFTQLYQEISKFKVYKSPSEIRKYKSMISGLINSNDKDLEYYFANLNINDKQISDDSKIISAVSTSPKASERYDQKDIIENYLFGKRKYAKEEMLAWTNNYFNSKFWVPLYAYIDVNNTKSLDAFKNKKNEQISKWLENNEKIPTIDNISALENIEKIAYKLKSLIKSLLKEKITTKTAKNYIKNLYNQNKNEIMKMSEFRICVTIISKLEYEKK